MNVLQDLPPANRRDTDDSLDTVKKFAVTVSNAYVFSLLTVIGKIFFIAICNLTLDHYSVQLLHRDVQPHNLRLPNTYITCATSTSRYRAEQTAADVCSDLFARALFPPGI